MTSGWHGAPCFRSYGRELVSKSASSFKTSWGGLSKNRPGVTRWPFCGNARVTWGPFMEWPGVTRAEPLRRLEALPLCLELQRWHRSVCFRITYDEERRQLKDGAYVANTWTRRRVTEVGDAFPRCHGTVQCPCYGQIFSTTLQMVALADGSTYSNSL